MSDLKFFIKTGCFLFLSLLCYKISDGQAQIKLTNLDINRLPPGAKYEGKVINAVKWTDKMGENIVLTTETGEVQSKNETDSDNRDAFLFAYHFQLRNDTAKQTWRVNDFIKKCEVDIKVSFIRNTFQVTDLNNDGICEVWLMYKIACTGDVSPSEMKIIMYQGQQKFAMRGRNKVQLSEKEFDGGEFKFDKSFEDGPKEFKEFALKLWNKNIMQKWE